MPTSLPEFGGTKSGAVRQIDLIEQNAALGRIGALVLDRPAYRVVFTADACRLRASTAVTTRSGGGVSSTVIGRALLVVVVGAVRIVRVDVDVLGALVHHVERVRTRR